MKDNRIASTEEREKQIEDGVMRACTVSSPESSDFSFHPKPMQELEAKMRDKSDQHLV